MHTHHRKAAGLICLSVLALLSGCSQKPAEETKGKDNETSQAIRTRLTEEGLSDTLESMSIYTANSSTGNLALSSKTEADGQSEHSLIQLFAAEDGCYIVEESGNTYTFTQYAKGKGRTASIEAEVNENGVLPEEARLISVQQAGNADAGVSDHKAAQLQALFAPDGYAEASMLNSDNDDIYKAAVRGISGGAVIDIRTANPDALAEITGKAGKGLSNAEATIWVGDNRVIQKMQIRTSEVSETEESPLKKKETAVFTVSDDEALLEIADQILAQTEKGKIPGDTVKLARSDEKNKN